MAYKKSYGTKKFTKKRNFNKKKSYNKKKKYMKNYKTVVPRTLMTNQLYVKLKSRLNTSLAATNGTFT